MKKNIKDFEWDIDLPYSDYKRVHIHIASAYQMGKGWTERDSSLFERELYPKLREAGFRIELPKDDWGCPHLKGMTRSEGRLDLYMHPMEFTGYVTEEQLQKVVKVLNSCDKDIIKGVRVSSIRDCYDLSDTQYEEMIVARAKEILSFCDKKTRSDDIALDFARECRLQRVGDSTGISSSDIDVRAVKNIVDVAKQLDYFEKSKTKNKEMTR